MFVNFNLTKTLWRWAITVVIAILAGGIARAETYTVSCYHGKYLSGDFEYYLTAKADDHLVAENVKMALAGIVTIEGRQYPYFTGSFDSEEVPTSVSFRFQKEYNEIPTSAFLDYVEGKLYNFDNTSELMLADAETSEPVKQTMLIVDKLGWGENMAVHGWNETNDSGPITYWNLNPTVSATGEYYLDQDGKYYPVYKYEYVYTGTIDKIVLHLKNGSQQIGSPDFQPGKLIVLSNSSVDFIGMPEELYQSEEKTIYFADKYGWCDKIYATITGSNGDIINQSLVNTRRFVKMGEGDADYYPLYKYTFNYINDPDKIYFYYREAGQPEENANPVEFVDNQIYFAEAEGTHQEVAYIPAEGVAQYAYEDLPEVQHTVYYIDRDKLGADKVRVHVWNGYSAYQEWEDDSSMQPYKFTEIGGQVYPVYSFTFDWRGAPAKLIFRGGTSQTGNLHYYEGYYYNNAGETVAEIEFADLPTYTVYFADRYFWGNEFTGVHIWRNENGQDIQWTQWAEDPTVTDTKTFVMLDGSPYRLYKYEFQWETEPNLIIFKKLNADGYVILQTADDQFQNGKVYVYTDKGKPSEIVDLGEQYTYDELPETEHTIYYIDNDNWDTVSVHIWGNTGDLFDWDHSEAMTPLGTTMVNGVSRTVYSYTFKYKGTPYGIIFKYPNGKNTKDWDFIDGCYYNTAGEKAFDVEVDEFPEYTVYLADRGMWGDNTRVHIWQTKGPDFTAWDNDPYATDTERYILVDGKAYRLYSYTFRWNKGGEPDMIIWKGSGYNIQTGDDKFEDGKVYIFTGSKNPAEVLDLPETTYSLEEVWPEYHKTYYFADTDYWGLPATTCHLWGDFTEASDWNSDLQPEDTGKWVKVNDLWSPLYKVETMYQDGKFVIFHNLSWYRQIGTCPSEDGKMYYYAGPKMVEDARELPEDLRDARPTDEPAEGRYIYVNLGANQMYRAGLWQEPHAKFYLREVGQEPNSTFYEGILPNPFVEEEVEEYESQKMEYVRDGFYKVYCPDINKYNEVIFYYAWKKENVENYYHGLAFPISVGNDCGNDPSTWATYVFDIGVNCMHQSYLTEDTYNSVWVENPDILFFMGNNAFDENANPDGGINPLIGKRIEKDEDVYIVPIGTIKPDKTVFFKISRFDAKAISEAEGKIEGKNYHYQRGFATNNPGTIGLAFPGNQLSGDWYDAHIADADEHNGSRMSKIFVNETVRINSYCQYPWRIGVGDGGVKENQEYWLVVDLHADDVNHNSLTLIEFDPQPVLKITDGGIHTEPLPIEDAQAIHDGDLLLGAIDNGAVYFDRVNVYSIDATLKQVGLQMLNPYETEIEVEGEEGEEPTVETVTVDAPYSVEYLLFMEYGEDQFKERIQVGKLEVPTDVEEVNLHISDLVYSPEVKYYLRAVFYDKANDRHFCSHYMPVDEHPVIPDLCAPAPSSTKAQLIPYSAKQRDGETAAIVGGAITFSYPEVTDSEGNVIEYAYFPDYLVTDIVVNDDEHISSSSALIHSNHFAAQQHGNHLGILATGDKLPWTPYTDASEDYCGHHNWSNYIRDEHHVPLFIDQIDSAPYGSKSIDATVTVDFTALYPFLIHPVDVENPAAIGSRARAISNGAAIFPVRKTAPASANLKATITVSGLDEIESAEDATEQPVEYFTITGQRLTSAPTAPGIYLRRQGARAEKFQVR